MVDIEKLAKKIMKECEQDGEPVTLEEAMEMAKMEVGAKDISIEARKDAPKAEAAEKRVRKVNSSDEKIALFSNLMSFLSENFENVTVLKENKLIEVKIGEKTLEINIVEHRKPKEKA